jgi:hypothetical protein
MNSEHDKPTRNSLASILTVRSTSQEEALAQRQNENTKLKDNILEERFCWILLSVILFDTAIFMNANNWAGPLSVLVIELLLIVVLEHFDVAQNRGF